MPAFDCDGNTDSLLSNSLCMTLTRFTYYMSLSGCRVVASCVILGFQNEFDEGAQGLTPIECHELAKLCIAYSTFYESKEPI